MVTPILIALNIGLFAYVLVLKKRIRNMQYSHRFKSLPSKKLEGIIELTDDKEVQRAIQKVLENRKK
jgi:hypothetical protein